MMKIRFEFGRLEANLRLLSEPVSRHILREGLRDAAEPMRKRMALLAPVDPDPDSGEHLKDKIGIGNAMGLDRQEIAIAVGPTVPGYYGSFQELGTFEFPAQPFARPAFDEMWLTALKLFAESCWRAVKFKIGGGRFVHVVDTPTSVTGGPGGGGLV